MEHTIHLHNDVLVVSEKNPDLLRFFILLRKYRGEETLNQFLKKAPCTGDTLWQLFEESERGFFSFVDDVIAGKYFWHGIGWAIGRCIVFPLLAIPIFLDAIFASEDQAITLPSEAPPTGISRYFADTGSGDQMCLGEFTDTCCLFVTPELRRRHTDCESSLYR